MSALIQPLVDTCNRVLNTGASLATSVLTINYHIGDSLFTAIKWIYTSFISLVCWLSTGLRIVLEDLVVFLVDISDSLLASWNLATNIIDSTVSGVFGSLQMVSSFVSRSIDAVLSGGSKSYQAAQYCANNIGVFFNLLGSSFILLLNLVPRTIILLSVTVKSFVVNSAFWSQQMLEYTVRRCTETVHWVYNAPPELYVGILVGTMSAAAVTKVAISQIQVHNITLESFARSFLRLICTAYVLMIRSIARLIGWVFTVIEVTVSNLRVPMMSHAGDSDDEEEDREHLVGELEDSDDEDRAREVQKRKNYDLLVQRRSARVGEGGSLEDDLLREVEREREDKLCVICVDKEKCIMILPCRHLCICESCQEPLRTHRNNCPICRKEIKQMIKAYL